MHKYLIGLFLGMFIGSEIVHSELDPQLIIAEKEISSLQMDCTSLQEEMIDNLVKYRADILEQHYRSNIILSGLGLDKHFN